VVVRYWQGWVLGCLVDVVRRLLVVVAACCTVKEEIFSIEERRSRMEVVVCAGFFILSFNVCLHLWLDSYELLYLLR